MNLDDYIKLGAIHNPNMWAPGFFWCQVCKQYQLVVSFFLEGEYKERLFCRECKFDIAEPKQVKES